MKIAERVVAREHAEKVASLDPEALAYEAIEASISGISPNEIALKFGIKLKAAKDLVADAIKSISRPRDSNFERGLDIARVDALIKALWPVALGSEEKGTLPCLQTTDRLTKLLERRARYLGLDEPTKTAHAIVESGSAGLTKDVANFFKADILGINPPPKSKPKKEKPNVKTKKV